MLRSRPEHEAMEILRRIRNNDVASTLAMVRDSDLLIPRQPLSPTRPVDALPPLATLTAGIDLGSASSRGAGNTLSTIGRTFSDPVSAGGTDSSESCRDHEEGVDPRL